MSLASRLRLKRARAVTLCTHQVDAPFKTLLARPGVAVADGPRRTLGVLVKRGAGFADGFAAHRRPEACAALP